LDGALAAHHDHGAGVGKVCGERFAGAGVQVADLDPSVAGVGLDKKGVVLQGVQAVGLLEQVGLVALDREKIVTAFGHD
jgi:hypothetical protein